MTILLITTPNFLLRYDADKRESFIIEDNRREYYGISWFDGQPDIYLSHSANKNQFVRNFADYAASETGYLSKGGEESWRFLSLPHQLLCVGDNILVTNTGRNCLSVVNKHDWSLRQFHYSPIKWDRYGAGVSIGHHFNSIYHDGKFIYILASNHDDNSFVIKVDPSTFMQLEILQCNASHMHNLWVKNSETIISCDSMNARLANISNNTTLWECMDRSLITRGLAATQSELFVGVSLRAGRDSRVKGDTGLWVIGATDYQTIDYHSVGDFGAVHDIRIIGERDLCHDHGIMHLRDDLMGIPLRLYVSQKKLQAIKDRSEARQHWDVKLGDLDIATDTSILSTGAELCIVVHSGSSTRNARVRAILDVSDPEATHTSLIARYLGPADTNMIIAMLRRESALESRISIWQHNGAEWAEICGTPYYSLVVDLEFSVEDDKIQILSEGRIVLNAKCSTDLMHSGKIGVRNLGGSVRSFSHL